VNARPAPRRGLGRGLGSLIPTAPVEAEGSGSLAPSAASEGGVPDGGEPQGQESSQPAAAPSARTADGAELAPVDGAWFAEVPIDQIVPNAVQPRHVFDEEAMAELVHSIREVGLLQPVVVRRTGPESYELVMGERRWRASQQAGLTEIPAIVRQTEDTDMLRDALLENLHRSQLNPLEEASAVPGVVRILTPDDFPEPAAQIGYLPPFETLTREIAYRGQPVALVVAETLEAAIEAAQAIDPVFETRQFFGLNPAIGAIEIRKRCYRHRSWRQRLFAV